MLFTVIIFIVVLGVLVLAHEFGHFFAAKKSGMKVEEFGFGFPPRAFGWQKTEGRWQMVWGNKETADKEQTIYSVNWIPFGGFVKIMGENNEKQEDPRSFINRPFWGRFLTLVAGVSMNLVLAWLLMSAALVIGLPAGIDNPKDFSKYAELKNVQIGVDSLVKDYPAEKAGMQTGDVILSVDGKSFAGADAMRDYIRSNSGKVFEVKIKRLSEELKINVSSLSSPPEGQGPTGMSLTSFGRLTVPWYIAPYAGAKATLVQSLNILDGLYRLFTGKISLSHVGGPVKIAQLTGEVGRMGAVYLIQFTATLSIQLAILNILPFPALDGGRVVLLVVEKLRRKRNNQKIEQWINTVGFVFLILLMIIVTIKDVKGF